MQRVNGHKHDIIILINQFDNLLCGIAIGQTYQSGKLPDAMVDVHHIVTRFELAEFFQRKGHLTASRPLTPKIIFMESVKYLMISEETSFQSMVSESLVQSLVHISKGDIVSTFLENVLQTLGLLLAIGTDIESISFRHEFTETTAHQLEILMKNRLSLSIESKGSLRCTRRLVAKLDTAEIQGLHHEIASVNQVLGNTQQFPLILLISSQCQRRNGFFVNLVNMFPNPEEILHGQNTILRDKLEERHELPTARHVQLGHNGNALFLFLRQLGIYLKRTDTVYLIAEKVDAVRIFGCIRKHIDNTTTQSILPRFIHIVHPFESKVSQNIHNGIDFRMSTHFQFQCTAREFPTRHDLLRHGFRTSHNA